MPFQNSRAHDAGYAESRGDGNFQIRSALRAGLTPVSVVASDVNSDGQVDLVSADRGSDQLSVYLGKGDGSFRDFDALRTGLSPVSVVAADLNEDDQMDLVSAEQDSRQLSIFFQ